MRSSVCHTCRSHFRNRIRERIVSLQKQRQSYHATPALHADLPSISGFQSWYWDTKAPTPEDLSSATTFFRDYPPRKLWTATEWRRQNEPTDGTLVPEVAFLGRSNVGKSSLLNALLLTPQLNHVGPRPGKTKTMHAWGLSATDPITGGAVKGKGGDMSVRVAVLDMPGYGRGSHGDWGEEIITYLTRRKQLKRAFILLDAMHGIKDSDLKMLQLLRKNSISHQIIASKCDRLPPGERRQPALSEALWKMRHIAQPKNRSNGFVALGEILAIAGLGDGRKNDKVDHTAMIGVEAVRYAVLAAAGLRGTNPLPLIGMEQYNPVSQFMAKTSPTGIVNEQLYFDGEYEPVAESQSDRFLTPIQARKVQADRGVVRKTKTNILDSKIHLQKVNSEPHVRTVKSMTGNEKESEMKNTRLVAEDIVDTASTPVSPRTRNENTHDVLKVLPKSVGSIGRGLEGLLAMTATKPDDRGGREDRANRVGRPSRATRTSSSSRPATRRRGNSLLPTQHPGKSGLEDLFAMTGTKSGSPARSTDSQRTRVDAIRLKLERMELARELERTAPNRTRSH